MSDDSITSFLKSHTTVESEVSPEKSLEKNTEVTDFKEIISQEEKKLSSSLSKDEVDNQVESKNSWIGIASIENPTEAIQSRKEGQVVDVNGNSFPTLSLHNRALAVGRVIYTSREVSVTSESLSKFMVRQGLVNESLRGGGESSNLEAASNQAESEGESESKPAVAEDNPDRSFWGDAASQLVVKQAINTHGVNGESKLVKYSEQSYSPESDTRSALSQMAQYQAAANENQSGVDSRARSANQVTETENPSDTLLNRQGQMLAGQQFGQVAKPLPEAQQDSEVEKPSNGPATREGQSLGGQQFGQVAKPILEAHREAEVENPSSGPVGKRSQLFMDQHLGRAVKSTAETHQDREISNSSDNPRTGHSELSIIQQFQDEVKSVVAEREKLSEQSVFKNKENQEDLLIKSQTLQTKDIHESDGKKVQGNGQIELQRFLAVAQKAPENSSERSSSSILLNQLDINEASVKGYRDAPNYNTSQEAVYSDSSQNRIEFKGALNNAQRLIASNTYNSLTDSYENWNARFSEVLAQRIAGYINRQTWNVQLRMNPASLGEISLELDFSEKGLEGRFGSNEESTRQLLQDTLPKLRLALREILEENQGLKFDISDFGNSNQDDEAEKKASPELVEDINFESEVLLGHTLDSELSSVVGLDILV